jgi:hypothetical protein|tara:strand:- start:189 stop:587 length:399 start_codon:yes stop_codon:yes gene_type:complete
MIKLKSLLTEKYLGFGNQGRLTEQQSQIANQMLAMYKNKTNDSNDAAITQCALDCIKKEMQRDLPNLQERDIDQLLDGLREGQIIRITNAISKFTVNLGNLATFIEAMLSPNMCKECDNIQTTPTGNTSTPI